MHLKLFQRFCGGFMKYEADLDGYLSVCSFGFTEEPTTHVAVQNVQVQFHLSAREQGCELMQVYHEILVGQERRPNIGDIVALVVSSSMLALCRYHLEQVLIVVVDQIFIFRLVESSFGEPKSSI
ncbi:uncharacterized protein M6B38_134470 [Iris pallida]|uniref:Uncharacterized protein n=1 Tax=Iris pallida TaxID=29817 RepID=A0AAX6FGH0_IRIPA|nr:uncharacterized protein M6B38_134470 [Iris pallida]